MGQGWSFKIHHIPRRWEVDLDVDWHVDFDGDVDLDPIVDLEVDRILARPGATVGADQVHGLRIESAVPSTSTSPVESKTTSPSTSRFEDNVKASRSRSRPFSGRPRPE